MRKVRKWIWTPFTNPARKDNAVFHHWKRASDEPKEYPFAQFNKVINQILISSNYYLRFLIIYLFVCSKCHCHHIQSLNITNT